MNGISTKSSGSPARARTTPSSSRPIPTPRSATGPMRRARNRCGRARSRPPPEPRDPYAEFDAEIRKLRDKFPDLPVKTRDDIADEIEEEAKRRREAMAEGQDVGWAGFGRFAGSAAALMTDRINVLSMLTGFGGASRAAAATLGGKLANVARVAATESAIGVVSEAAIQPSVFDFKREIGSQYTMADALENVAMAGIGGAAFGGGVQALGHVGESLIAKWRRAKAAGVVAEDVDARMAEVVMTERERFMEANRLGDDVTAEIAHQRIADEAMAALMEGRPVEGQALAAFREHRQAKITRMVAKALGETTDEKAPDMVAYGVITPAQARELLDKGIGKHLPEGHRLDIAVRRMDGEAVRKALRKHGSDDVPLRREDFERIPEVAETGELVSVDVQKGRVGIERRKLIDGDWLYVVETIGMTGTAKPPKKITLRVHTAYRNRGPKEKGPLPEGLRPQRPFHVPDPHERPTADVLNDHDGPALEGILPPSGDELNRTAPVRAAEGTVEAVGGEAVGVDDARPNDPRAVARVEDALDRAGDAGDRPDTLADVQLRRTVDDTGDFDVPQGIAAEEGVNAPETRTAKEIMDEAEAEVGAVDAFDACLRGGTRK